LKWFSDHIDFCFLKLFIMGSMMMASVAMHGQQDAIGPSEIIDGVFLGETPPLKDLPAVTEEEWQAMVDWAKAKADRPKVRTRTFPYAETALPKGPDPAWQSEMGGNRDSHAPILNFTGSNSAGWPSDANGAIGPDHYMQTINVVYTIYNRAGAVVAGPTALNTLFTGTAGSNYNNGDPVILYDEQADRWLVAEFSISGANDYILIAVSTTNDPTGTWYKYSFDVSEVPDYPKLGIWQDAYYMGTNTTSASAADIYAFNREQMLTGQAPQGVGFDNPWRPTTWDSFSCVPPLDNDGDFAPDGEPGLFIACNDDAIGGGSDQLWIYELDVDWSTPANSTFLRTQQINVEAFDSNFGFDLNNIKQPNTTRELDAIPQVIMNPPQYRNFGAYETIVCCHSVDVDNTDHAGIRWYELRRVNGGDWTIRQQGTYAPDGHSRWMGSIMLNGANEIALGYSISSSTVYPGIRYCGQSASAYAAGNSILDVSEEIIHTGVKSQTNYNRWGDYSSMQVDVADDETFWFTSQYSGTNDTVKTKIANFQIGTIILTSNFAASNPNPQTNTAVYFTDVSYGSPTSWNWTIIPSNCHFLSGTTNQSQHPVVQFTEAGSYTVSLIVSNGTSNDTITKTGFINVQDCGYVYLPYNVDFADSTLPACWKNIDNWGLGQTWVFDNPNSRPVNTASAGNGFAILDSYGYGPGYSQNADLITPLLDLSAYTTVNLYFQHWFYYQTPSTGRLFYSINGGATWTQITYWSSTTTNPAIYNQDVTSFVAGQSRVRFKWSYTATYGIIWAIDDISITGTGPNLWTGATSGDWATATNWSAGTVPTNTSNVFIPATAPNWPTITGNFTLGTSCDKMTMFGSSQLNVTGNVILPAGETLAFNGDGIISLTGNWINTGATIIPGNGAVKFTGSSPSKIVPVTTTTSSIANYQRSTFPAGMTELTGATTGPTGNDAGTNITNIGFSFNYCGINYTRARLCTNGWLMMATANSTLTSNLNPRLFNTSTPNLTLAPWWDDLNADGSSLVSYKTEGTSPYRVFTAEWKNVLTFSTGATERISFQVKLFETTNIIEFHYGNVTSGTNSASESASIGIEDATGGSGRFIEATTGSSTTGVTTLTATSNWPAVNYRFSPPASSQILPAVIVDKPGSYLDLHTSTTVNGDLTVTNGSVSCPGAINGVFNVKGDLSNNGNLITGLWNVNFNGAVNQNIGGTTSTSFNKLKINNPAGITLLNNLQVTDSLTMTSGNLDCGAYTLELGTSATNPGKFIYSSGNISGNFKRWIAASTAGPVDFPVGTSTNSHNARITFSNNTGGSLTVKFIPGDPGGNTGFPLTEDAQTINENNLYTEGYWTLVPATLSSTNYALELTGSGFSTAGAPDGTVRILKRPDGGGDWTLNGTHVEGTAPIAKRSGLSGFSQFILAKPGTGNSISGNIKYYNQAFTPLTNGITVKLFLDGNQVGSDFTVTNGTYLFSGLNPGTYQLQVISSLSTEGSINTTDAAQVNYWGALPYEIEKVRFYAGDVTGSTFFLNSTDAQRIQQNFVSGTAFDKGNWAFWRAGETISSNSNPPESYPVVALPVGNITANLYGLCAGDFNRSFVPGLAMSASNTLQLIHSGTIHAGPDQVIELPVTTEHACEVAALSLILDVPGELAEFLDVEMSHAGGQLDWAIKKNELRIGWSSTNPVHLNAGEELIILKIRTTTLFTRGKTIRVSLAPTPLNEMADAEYNVLPGALISLKIIESVLPGKSIPESSGPFNR
jgi:hypothetical protein